MHIHTCDSMKEIFQSRYLFSEDAHSLRYVPRRLFVLKVIYFAVQLLSGPCNTSKKKMSSMPESVLQDETWFKVASLTCPSLCGQFARTSCDCVHHAQANSPVRSKSDTSKHLLRHFKVNAFPQKPAYVKKRLRRGSVDQLKLHL